MFFFHVINPQKKDFPITIKFTNKFLILLESKKQDFLSFDVNRQLDRDVVYKLEDGRYLVVFSKKKIAQLYKEKFGEGKRLKPSKK